MNYHPRRLACISLAGISLFASSAQAFSCSDLQQTMERNTAWKDSIAQEFSDINRSIKELKLDSSHSERYKPLLEECKQTRTPKCDSIEQEYIAVQEKEYGLLHFQRERLNDRLSELSELLKAVEVDLQRVKFRHDRQGCSANG